MSFFLAGENVPFPALADGRAIKNSAVRFARAWSLPDDAAFSLAAAVVDPAVDRNKIDAKNPFDHLQAIQTPDGKFLLAHRTTVWTWMISGDGGNGRSRYEIQTADHGRFRPWPIGRHHAPAIIDYHPSSLDDMLGAVKLSADTIRSQDLVTQIRRSPRGVWNPPVLVLARAYVTATDGSVDERWFLHSIDGSTRVEACHDLTDTPATAPLNNSAAPLDYLRESHKRMIDRFNTTPAARNTLHAARAATMPALVVVAVVEDDMTTKIKSGFPSVVNDYVESVHVQPRPFSDVAQANVIGERFVLTLRDSGGMDHETAEALLGRAPDVEGVPTVRAATLVRSVCAPENETLVRDFVITDEGKRLTKSKRAKLIAPLVVRQFEEAAPSAERALMRAFTPERLIEQPWKVSGQGSEALRAKCVADVNAGKFDSFALAELMARGGPALCAAGLLLGDQESTVMAISELRGSVEKVVEKLATIVGGVHVLADAIAWADGGQAYKPKQYDVEGNVRVDSNGDALHYSDDWRNGNLLVRALAFTGGDVPERNGKKPEAEVPKTPEESYKWKERELIERLGSLTTLLRDMYTLKDEQARSVIERIGMQRAHVYVDFPQQLTRLYLKYGNDEPFVVFSDDELPLEELPESEGEGDGEEDE